MECRTIKVNNITISYLEQNLLCSNTIFFFHGNSNDCSLWTNLLIDSQFKDYRLIAFDFPGHGLSSKSTNPKDEYNVKSLSQIMGEAIGQLTNGEPYILAGLSLGTNVIAEMLYLEMNPTAIILLSAGIVGGDIKPHHVIESELVANVLFAAEANIELVGKYFDIIAMTPGVDKDGLLNSYYQTDPLFRSNFKASIAEGKYSDEIKVLRERALPTLIVYGSRDNVIRPDLLDHAGLKPWKNQIVKVPDAGHLLVLEKPEELGRLILDFANEVFKNNPPSSYI